eukprot:CAMPEP_0194275648 /NCGR_PEP_ID=MMETSP0169-20130528/8431_1 /TAXON_ID=218684 /ORGANISM="Corethron pennatum, Strain L29A3" /LENGTH=362 /DNA_ID=CAMNT_0039019157 /DNA_START=1531 /DNA_END=2616 /DNA_ORIENTATION=-
MGLVGTGSFALAAYLHCAGYPVAHGSYRVGFTDRTADCGECISNNLDDARSRLKPRGALDGCGTYEAYTQIGYFAGAGGAGAAGVPPGLHLPQSHLLEEIVSSLPEATFVVTLRSSAADWVAGIVADAGMREAFARADLRGMPAGAGSEEDLVGFYERHLAAVRAAVGDGLIEIKTDGPEWAVGPILSDAFGIHPVCWGYSVKHQRAPDPPPPPHVFSIGSDGMQYPIDRPSTALKLQTPIISLGLPLAGSANLFNFFHCGGVGASHYRCSGRFPQNYGRFLCGDCVRHNVAAGRPMFSSCGPFSAWTQLGSPLGADGDADAAVYLPQVQALQHIHREHPFATFVLTIRDPDAWAADVARHP